MTVIYILKSRETHKTLPESSHVHGEQASVAHYTIVGFLFDTCMIKDAPF